MANHLLDSHASYYYQNEELGNYQFISLKRLINQFMVAYVGEEKIVSRVSRTDVQFHAQRALAEMSFDTFKSVKAHEFTVAAYLTQPLPQDYVNYTKLAWVDSSGIEHTLYPTSKTSNPQYTGNLVDFHDGHLTSNADVWTLGTGFAYDSLGETGGAILGGTVTATTTSGITTKAVTSTVAAGTTIEIPVNFELGKEYHVRWRTPALVEDDVTAAGAFKVYGYSEAGYKATHGKTSGGNAVSHTFHNVGAGDQAIILSFHDQSSQFETTSDTDSYKLVFEVTADVGIAATIGWIGKIDNIVVTEVFPGSDGNTVANKYGKVHDDSTTWSNYKGSTPAQNQDNYQDDTYWPLDGERYGLDPQHAQANGSFYIDGVTGMIHFSSNLGGKTVTLKYISDGLGTTEELQVHKLAEEAMYKWILYAILSTKFGVPEYIIQRFKKEKIAETRKAKLRLSNIKLEEITQVLRGKSKQIKH